MKRLFAAAALTLATTATAVAAPESYTLDPHHSYPSFRVSHLGISMQLGRFDKSSGKITIDREARTGSVDLTIDVSSIDMGIDRWDAIMRSDDYFDVEKYPTMTFRSTKLLFDDDRVVGAEGDFTLLGVTRPLSVTFSGFKCAVNPYNKKHICGGMASGTLMRSDFGMKKSIPSIADEVHFEVSVEAIKD